MLYSTVNMCWKPEVTTDMQVPSTVHCASLELPPIKRPVTSRRGGGGGLVKGDPNCEPLDALFTSFGISEISELLTKSSISPLEGTSTPATSQPRSKPRNLQKVKIESREAATGKSDNSTQLNCNQPACDQLVLTFNRTYLDFIRTTTIGGLRWDTAQLQ